MDEVTGMIWNAVLSLIVAPLIIIIGAQVKELRRIDILLNRTREELGREYVSKVDLDSIMSRIMGAIDRLSQKVDRLFEERT